jgi:hypothetical protein
MVYLVEFHEITKILLTLREITKKITKNFQLPKKSEKSRNITKSNLNYQIWSHCHNLVTFPYRPPIDWERFLVYLF